MKARSYEGVLKIVTFNWPFYVAAAAGDGIGFALLARGLPRWAALATVAALVLGNGWLVVSLAVSHWVYDRSAVSEGAWLDAVPPAAREIAVFHTGHDETSTLARRRFPEARIAIYDLFDPDVTDSASLRRARARAAPGEAMPVPMDRLPLGDGVLDAALVVFAAHEVRDAERLTRFFAELRRTLAAQGVAIVVEHLRDPWNALAYGPGALHFLPRDTWSRAFAGAGLATLRETRFTPFVASFCLTAEP